MFLDLAPARKSNVRNSPAKQNISRSINFIHEAQLLQVTNLIIFILWFIWCHKTSKDAHNDFFNPIQFFFSILSKKLFIRARWFCDGWTNYSHAFSVLWRTENMIDHWLRRTVQKLPKWIVKTFVHTFIRSKNGVITRYHASIFARLFVLFERYLNFKICDADNFMKNNYTRTFFISCGLYWDWSFLKYFARLLSF